MKQPSGEEEMLNRTNSSPSLRDQHVRCSPNTAASGKWRPQTQTSTGNRRIPLQWQPLSGGNNQLFTQHHPSCNKLNHLQEEAEWDKEEVEEDATFYVIGDRVLVDGDPQRRGSVAYFGEVDFARGDWVGVALDEPLGLHDGKLHGRKYFQCAPLHGILLRSHRVSRLLPTHDSALGSSASSSRAATPLPTSYQPHLYRRPAWSSSSPSSAASMASSPNNYGGRASSVATSVSSPLDSYYYDEDYRQERAPSVAALARKLRAIDRGDRGTRDEQFQWSPAANDKPVGILKSRSPTDSGNRSISARAAELSRRLRASSSSPPAGQSVFNFRPKRAQLNDEDDGSINGTTTSSKQLETSGGRHSVDLSSEPPRKGDRVVVRTERGDMLGILRFMGETYFATGEWAGVELDVPEGKNDGSVLNYRYFHCPNNYGLFVPATRVSKANTSDHPDRLSTASFNAMRSTLKSPPPSAAAQHSTRSSGIGGSTATWSPSLFDSSNSASPTWAAASSNRSPQYSSSIYDSKSPRSGVAARSRSTSNVAKLTFADEICKSARLFERPKFDERDIEIQLKKSLHKPSSFSRQYYSNSSLTEPQVKPKAVRYTFSQSKYDGNPVAHKTVLYE